MTFLKSPYLHFFIFVATLAGFFMLAGYTAVLASPDAAASTTDGESWSVR